MGSNSQIEANEYSHLIINLPPYRKLTTQTKHEGPLWVISGHSPQFYLSGCFRG